jgi:L-ascorbate metabolism protein UlaG (beta-lactamase superfamily)
MHWGDNRPDPNDHVWDMLGQIDVAIMPIDSSIHLLTYDETDTICARLGVKVIVPSHYFIWDLMQRSSTLQPATDYVGAHDHIEVGGATHTLERQAIVDWRGKVLHFGDHVAFDKPPRVKGQDWG